MSVLAHSHVVLFTPQVPLFFVLASVNYFGDIATK